MKYALIEGQRREAQRGISGECAVCGSAMLAKCGEHRVWHWAHRGKRNCDHWWEPETDWHRTWKNCFPAEWQEQIHWAESGEKHIADVKTEHGRVIEFQHSYIRPAERRSREEFYGRMFWVVNGLRRERDKSQFLDKLHSPRIVCVKPLMLSVSADKCALFRDWAESRVPVLFDFGAPILWLLHPKSPAGRAYLAPVHRSHFVEAMLKGLPMKGMDYSGVVERARRANSNVRTRAVTQAVYKQQHRRIRRPLSFQQYMARKRRARSRIRM